LIITKFHYKFIIKNQLSLVFDNETRSQTLKIHGDHPKSQSTCNFHTPPILETTSAYHIPYYNLVISFMWMRKWNTSHMHKPNTYLEPKFWNIQTMGLVHPLVATNFATCDLLLGVLWIQQYHSLPINKL
jgi:hypothetical protein